MNERIFGVDVGGTTVKIGLFDREGTLLRKWEIPTRREDEGKNILPDTAASILQEMKEQNILPENVLGVGLGVPGPVLPDGTVERCVNLGWKETVDLDDTLGKLLGGIPVTAGNDANVAALGEVWKGAGVGRSSAVMVTLGTGVGGGIVINGEIICGAHGMGGEIGHMHVRDDDLDVCNCGGQGCVEQSASATGLVREAKRVLAANPDTESSMRRSGDALDSRRIIDCAKDGDALASQAVDTMANYLGRALANIAMVVDPEAFIIGGGVSRAGAFLTDIVTRYYHRYSPLSKKKSYIVLASLGNDAGMYGAAKLVLNRFGKS